MTATHVTRTYDLATMNAAFLDLWLPRSGAIPGPLPEGRALRWAEVIARRPYLWACSCGCAGPASSPMVARSAAFAHRLSHA